MAAIKMLKPRWMASAMAVFCCCLVIVEFTLAKSLRESIFTSTPMFPLSPSTIHMRLLLMSHNVKSQLQLPAEMLITGNWSKPVNLTGTSINVLKRISAHFRSNKGDTLFIIHGFRYTPRANDYFDKIRWIVQSESKSRATNVLLVDWSTVGESASYMQIVASVSLMGEMLNQLIHRLHTHHHLDVSRLRIIGHSVGAHVAGQTAVKLKKAGIFVSHLLALDPAGPFFRSQLPEGRLDRSDAEFVECWYSASASTLLSGLGSNLELGHLNLYINGGHHQPGCEIFKNVQPFQLTANFKLLKKLFNCDHHRGMELMFDQTRDQCQLIAYKCDSYDKYLNGHCYTCGMQNESCHWMTYHQLPVQLKTGNFYLKTGSESPYCAYTYRLVIHHFGFESGLGQYFVQFNLKSQHADYLVAQQLDPLSLFRFDFKPSNHSITTKLISSSMPLHLASTVHVQPQDSLRNHLWFWLQMLPNRKLHVHQIELQYLSHISVQ